MRKICFTLLALLLVCFLIPVIFTKPFETMSKNIEKENIINQEEEAKQPKEQPYDYKEFNTIKLYHTKENQIEEVNLEEYLYHVVSAEMPADFEMEACDQA